VVRFGKCRHCTVVCRLPLGRDLGVAHDNVESVRRTCSLQVVVGTRRESWGGVGDVRWKFGVSLMLPRVGFVWVLGLHVSDPSRLTRLPCSPRPTPSSLRYRSPPTHTTQLPQSLSAIHHHLLCQQPRSSSTMSLTCPECGRGCKNPGGLTRHRNSAHLHDPGLTMPVTKLQRVYHPHLHGAYFTTNLNVQSSPFQRSALRPIRSAARSRFPTRTTHYPSQQ
jgi:hypothetical protein